MYKVKWASGQEGPTVTWEPGRNLRNASDLLDECNRTAGLVAGAVSGACGSAVGATAFFAHQVPTPGDSVVLSDGLQALVASVEGDILQVEAPMSGSRRVHAASVHKTPSWRDEARALDDSCFQGHAVAEDAACRRWQ